MSKAQKGSRRQRKQGLDVSGASGEARKTASVILQVMAGTLRPYDAAEVLGMTPQKYYNVEARAMEGLVRGCEPRRRGAPSKAEDQLKQLQQEHLKAQRECTRLQALVRALQRTVGVRKAPAKSGAKDSGKSGGKGKRKRGPTVRALRMAKRVGGEGATAEKDSGPS